MSVIPCGGLNQELKQQTKLQTENLQHTSQRRLLASVTHKELKD